MTVGIGTLHHLPGGFLAFRDRLIGDKDHEEI